MKKLTRKDVPPGTWVTYLGGKNEPYLTKGKRYQISTCSIHQGESGDFINILGSKVPNGDGGYNILMADFKLSEEVINNYDIF